jgi:hypothetical protein
MGTEQLNTINLGNQGTDNVIEKKTNEEKLQAAYEAFGGALARFKSPAEMIEQLTYIRNRDIKNMPD